MAKILVVDDEPEILTAMKKYLEEDYQVLTAEDARSAIALFQRESPSVVISDIKMPDIDGIELMRRIKGMGRDVEVILLTGHGDMQTAIESLRMGASEFLVKPVDVDSLGRAIRNAFEKLHRRDQRIGLLHRDEAVEKP